MSEQLGVSSKDTPDNADYSCLNVEDGDIIVLGTDGLWDNLYQTEITNHIRVGCHSLLFLIYFERERERERGY